MPSYKFEKFLRHSNDALFDKTQPAGIAAPRSGIYRCEGCGVEITCVQPGALPGEEHHKHTPQQKLVRWRLVVGEGVTPAAASGEPYVPR